MTEPSSLHSSNSDMSFDDEGSIQDFLSNIESEYDSGLDTSYSDISAATSTSHGSELRDDFEALSGSEIRDVEPTPVSCLGPDPLFQPLPPLRDSSVGSLGLSPPSVPSWRRNSSFGSVFDSLLSKPISSIGSIGTINSNVAFDVRDAFGAKDSSPPPPLTSLSRQITPPIPPIPEYNPFSGGFRRASSRKVSEDATTPMDVDRETSPPEMEMDQDAPFLPTPPAPEPTSVVKKEELAVAPPPPATQVTPPTPKRKKPKRRTPSASHQRRPTQRDTSAYAKPKRKRREQKKRTRRVEPKVKKFVAMTPKDVLMGRGGCSNHHPGNEIYRKRILTLQKTYKTLSREAKTKMSKDVVKWVHGRGGQFLQKEGKDSWYVVTTETARQKVSQALREDHTVEGRLLKKARTTSSKLKENKANPSLPEAVSS